MTISAVNTAPAPARPPRTALQKHVDFFDRNGDGETRVWETYGGLRALGLGRILSAGAAVVINLALGIKTGSPWYKLLTVQNDNIHLGKHGGDTDVYDEQGNFVQSRFDAMFQLHDGDQDDALNQGELDAMMLANGGGKASAGSRAEFGLLMKIAGQDTPAGRVLTRQRLQEFYDGTLFYSLAGETPP
ncbi:MAG: caleosin family protein [Candidatus Eremiobacterota bacterium]